MKDIHIMFGLHIHSDFFYILQRVIVFQLTIFISIRMLEASSDWAVPSYQFERKKNVTLDRVALPTQGLM
jgi:hypothetical protein